MIEQYLPIRQIGEDAWADKLRAFLKENEIEVASVPVVDARLPQHMRDYFAEFGGIDDSDFMYGLCPPAEFVMLADADWEFISLSFQPADVTDFLVFAQSPANDPVCLHLETGGIYLFSHDPVRKSKMFKDFSDYVVHELIEFINLMVVEADDKAARDLKDRLLVGADIDFEARYISL